jgi:hypothetical protein
MSPAIKNGLLLVVLVAILGLAGWFFTKGRKESIYPDDPNTVTEWMCGKCAKHYPLTAAKYKGWLESKDKVSREPGVTAVTFWCEDCKEFKVVRARVDQETREWYIPGGVGDKRAAAPKAPPDPKKVPKK